MISQDLLTNGQTDLTVPNGRTLTELTGTNSPYVRTVSNVHRML